MVKGKDKLNKDGKHNVIYQIKCQTEDCQESYIGRTTKTLETKMREHRSNIRKQYPNEHTVVTKHWFDWDNITIFDEEQNFNKLCLSEMLHITTTKHMLNSQTDTQSLN